MTRVEIAFSHAGHLVRSVPLGKTDKWFWFFWFSSRTAQDEELAKLANEVVILLEYEVHFELREKRTGTTSSGNETHINPR